MIRKRLEANAEEWNNLVRATEELVRWIRLKEDDLIKRQPVGGDYNSIQQQISDHKVMIGCKINGKFLMRNILCISAMKILKNICNDLKSLGGFHSSRYTLKG